MGCLKDIFQDAFQIPVVKFYSESLNTINPNCLEALEQYVMDYANQYNSSCHLDDFRREFSTVSVELPNFSSEEDFTDFINNRSSHLNTKFDFSYYGMSTMVIRLCASILSSIDKELNKPGSCYSEITRNYAYLRNTMMDSAKAISGKLNIPEDKFKPVYFESAIEHIAYPYLINLIGTTLPVNPHDMWNVLFDQDVVIYDTFINDDCYDDLVKDYGPYGEAFYMLNKDMLGCRGDTVSKEIFEIYIKTAITMLKSVEVMEEYLFDLQDFCKKYYQACCGEYTFEYDERFRLVNCYDYPKKYWINSTESLSLISLEADSDAGAMSAQNTSMTPTTTANNASLDQVDEKYKQKSLKLQKLINDVFKVNKEKLKAKMNESFFKKWIGRVPSMYQHYANSAMMYENRMKGDPTQILLEGGVNYLNEMTSRTESIFNELINTCKKVTSAGDIQAKVNAVKGFCKQYPIEDLSAEPKTIKEQIVNEACYRISDAILQDNGVYGYTAEGIVQNKKFPTSNHIVTSLFVENAQEKAEEQSVGSIFSSPDSLTIFATPEKLNVLESSFRKTTNAIMTNFNPRMVSTTQKNMHQNYKLYVNNLSKRASAQGADSDTPGEDINQTKKVAKALEDGLIDALDIVVEQKKRCIQCVGSMYEMGGRIANLAKRCIAALHDEEAKLRDNGYETGSNARSLNRSTKNASKQNLYNSGQSKSITQVKRDAMKAKLEAARNVSRYGGRQ